jgi:hypothetical protein
VNNNPVVGRERRTMRKKTISVFALAIVATPLWAGPDGDTSPIPSDGYFPTKVERVLHSLDKATLYSIEPFAAIEPPKQPPPAGSTLDGFTILGQMDLDGQLAKTVIATFEEAVASWQSHDPAGCFDPHHALRVTSRGETYDLLLCYACGQIRVYSANQVLAELNAGGTSKKLDAILIANHVPLSESGEVMKALQK